MTGDAPSLALEPGAGCLRFRIHVTPRAKRPGLGGLHGDALRVAVAEAPEAGAANRACVEAIARALGVRRADVSIEAGARGRRKRVRVDGEPAVLAERLRRFARNGPGR